MHLGLCLKVNIMAIIPSAYKIMIQIKIFNNQTQ